MQLTEILRFTVPGKPVGKARPRFTRRGFAYTPEKTVRYEAAVRAERDKIYPPKKRTRK